MTISGNLIDKNTLVFNNHVIFSKTNEKIKISEVIKNYLEMTDYIYKVNGQDVYKFTDKAFLSNEKF